MDRCALFVDAGYVLADGAMAVHGTRRGESVSWDYEGLLQLLSSLARERSGLPVLRCYWYEATVDGRRTAEQDALADVPGIKLRVAKIRPGRREGVETEIHRDLTTLARNNAISDALVVSAEEDLAQVIADVQDLGLRVTLVHIAVDGNWTISRALRQESDDIMEISGDHLRPYVELIAGAEPVPAEEPESADQAVARPLSNGHSLAGAVAYQPMPATASHAPPAIYTAPVVAEYQRPALQLPRVSAPEERPREDRAREDRAREDRAREERAREREDRSRDDRSRDNRSRDDRPREDRTAQPAVNGEAAAPSRQEMPSRADIYTAPVTTPRVRQDRAERQDRADRPDRADRQDRQDRTERQDRQEPASVSPAARARGAEEGTGYSKAPSSVPEVSQGATGISGGNGMAAANGLPGGNGSNGMAGNNGFPAGSNGLPSGNAVPGGNGMPGGNGVAGGASGLSSGTGMPGSGPEATNAQPGQLRRLPSARTPQPGSSQPGSMGSVPMSQGQHAVPGQGSSRSSAPYSGPQPVMSPLTPYQPASSAPSAAGVSLSDAVQAAHEEGQEFGGSVARDAPALWLEAVLARKPRMPSDLEARLLQGSALPIDFLLHDEVRHALRRGFWDALERTRR